MNRRMAVAVLMPLLAGACATTSTFPVDSRDMRLAQEAPVHFVTVDGAAGVANACVSPLVDPRDQTRLRLVRSGSVGASHRGDYAVEGGRYGVRAGELLRIDCGTGQALGIVPN